MSDESDKPNRILELIFPEGSRSITVKIIGSIQRHGNATGKDARFYCNVRIWAWDDRKYNIFKMKVTPSLWWSIYEGLKFREESGMDLEIDKQLICVVGKIITIDAIIDIKKSFVKKDGSIDFPKFFKVRFREDLEEIDSNGSVDELKVAREKDWKENKHCIEENLIVIRDLIEKKENKEKEKFLKLREKQEKANKELQKFSNYWDTE